MAYQIELVLNPEYINVPGICMHVVCQQPCYDDPEWREIYCELYATMMPVIAIEVAIEE